MKVATRNLIDCIFSHISDAQDLWLSEFCCSGKEHKNRIEADTNDFNYAMDQLREIDNTFTEKVEVRKGKLFDFELFVEDTVNEM